MHIVTIVKKLGEKKALEQNSKTKNKNKIKILKKPEKNPEHNILLQKYSHTMRV